MNGAVSRSCIDQVVLASESKDIAVGMKEGCLGLVEDISEIYGVLFCTDDGLIWIYRIVGASDIMKASGGDEPGQIWIGEILDTDSGCRTERGGE